MGDCIVVAMCRMNPPTLGHEKLLDKVMSVAAIEGGQGFVHLSQSHDSKKNPIDYYTKLQLVKTMMPDYADLITDSSVKNFMDMLIYHSDINKSLHIVAGSDRIDEYDGKVKAYMGKLFDYKSVTFHSAGVRDISGISASKARHHAIKGKFSEFEKMMPSTAHHSDVKRVYDIVRENIKCN